MRVDRERPAEDTNTRAAVLVYTAEGLTFLYRRWQGAKMKADSDSHSWRAVIPVVALLVGMSCLTCEDAPPSRRPSADKSGAQQYDDDYIAALAVADEFCHAWRMRNFRDGKALLSRRLIRQHSDDRLADAIVGLPNPSHAGYEIFGGKRLSDGRIAFKVRLFQRHAGQHADRIEGPLEELVMVREKESGQWRVDEFPFLAKTAAPEAPARLPVSGTTRTGSDRAR